MNEGATRCQRGWQWLSFALFSAAFILCLSLLGCRAGAVVTLPEPEISVSSEPILISSQPCSGRFVAQQLAHETTVPGGADVRMFEANGAGLAINDLDNDGDMDVVLANHDGPNSILWNQGSLRFLRMPLGDGNARAVTIVDLDSDGWQDILLTRRISAPNYWRNNGNSTFTLELLPGVDKPLYALNVADLDGDSDLDFVGATYDAALLTEFGQEFLSSGQAGVYVYNNDAGRFRAERLAPQAQALALVLSDLNEDGRTDILVGNDFAVPDYTWLRTEEGWVETTLFDNTTHSTMSLDVGDIDNDGRQDLFATDMKPYADDEVTQAAWEPLMSAMMSDPHLPGDLQVMENVLQRQVADGDFLNEAGARGVSATGWSWSAKFGDLNQDGYLDLYVVNGFMESTTFGHLRDHELVEENQAFANDGQGHFQPRPQWGLGVTQSGRGMSMADMDGDGDLDIIINNLRSPALLLENRLCAGNSVQVDLVWPASGNGRALGSTLRLTAGDTVYTRVVRAASGYLSGNPARVHFGVPDGLVPQRLQIIWPDGAVSDVSEPDLNSTITIIRN